MFSERLKSLRLSHNMTQKQLAEALGISKSTISMYENGNREPDFETLEAIADILNVDMDQLIGRSLYVPRDSVPKRIRIILKYKNISISKLAELLDVDKNNLYDFIFNTPVDEFNYNDPRLHNIADVLGISVDAFFGYNIFSDDTTDNYINFLFDKIDKGLPLTKQESKIVCDYINSSSDTDFLHDNIIPLPKTKSIPLVGSIACGTPILAVENIEDYVKVDEKIPADFALRCKGDSMINSRIYDGDIVYIRQQPDVDDGEIAAVLIGEEATLKKVYKYPNKVVLRASNPIYDDMVYTDEELEDIVILGKAVAFFSLVR